jgi:hypothetical protein
MRNGWERCKCILCTLTWLSPKKQILVRLLFYLRIFLKQTMYSESASNSELNEAIFSLEKSLSDFSHSLVCVRAPQDHRKFFIIRSYWIRHQNLGNFLLIPNITFIFSLSLIFLDISLQILPHSCTFSTWSKSGLLFVD